MRTYCAGGAIISSSGKAIYSCSLPRNDNERMLGFCVSCFADVTLIQAQEFRKMC